VGPGRTPLKPAGRKHDSPDRGKRRETKKNFEKKQINATKKKKKGRGEVGG